MPGDVRRGITGTLKEAGAPATSCDNTSIVSVARRGIHPTLRRPAGAPGTRATPAVGHINLTISLLAARPEMAHIAAP